MDTVFSLIFGLLCIYAIVTILTVIRDFRTGRYRRLRSLRNDMNEAEIELRRRREGSTKILESLSND